MTITEFVMANLPLRDNKKIRIHVHVGHPLCKRKSIYGESVDVTSTVNKLMNKKKLKRVRKYGYGHSGHAGHTFIVKA